jgi:uncharacterized protein (UPF0332 family)
MTPSDFYAFAANLAVRSSGPAGFRSSTSRAYYAAYHATKQLVEASIGIRCNFGGSEHAGLQRYFLNCEVEEGVELGQMLQNLHQSRREADYELNNLKCETQVQAKFCLERANAIMSRVEECKEPPLLAKIRAGIERYKTKINA